MKYAKWLRYLPPISHLYPVDFMNSDGMMSLIRSAGTQRRNSDKDAPYPLALPLGDRGHST